MRKNFAHFCAFLTDFSVIELEGTGLLDSYDELLHQILGAKLASTFDGLVDRVVGVPTQAAQQQQFQQLFVASDVFWPVASALLSLWYTGLWNALPDSWYQQQGLPVPAPGTPGSTACPSDSAYIEQLSYRAASAHPPGAKPTGYASWSIPPVI